MQFKLPSILILGLSTIFLTNCKPATKNEVKQTEVQDTTKETTDTTSANINENPASGLVDYLDNVHAQFDDLTSPFEAKYSGFSMGDYPHIVFEAKDGKEYDFGDGENSFGTFKEEAILDENSKYKGKKFKVTWEWKTASFNCCEGEMTLMTAKVPTIVNLELMK
jgi:hypothetical protein